MGGSKEVNCFGGEKIEVLIIKWLFKYDFMVEIKVIENF